jgi:hypothetical protein
MSDYKQLEVWKKAHAVTMEIYALTKTFPVEERFGLVTQMRRAAVSIGANLAEGRGRRGDPEFGRLFASHWALRMNCNTSYSFQRMLVT